MKKAKCKGNFGYSGKKGWFIPVESGVKGLIKNKIYWIPDNYNLKAKGSLFEEVKEKIKEK